jgi:hypothetical protein
VKEKINIDPRRIYVCGFSGGSRVASSVAIFDGSVNCVIGMGAGFPFLSAPIRNHFDYIGFVGNQDFNMNELVALDSAMANSTIRHQLIIFNGKHEWAPADVAEDAFVYLEVNAMKDGLIAKNDTLFKNFIAKNEREIKNASQSKNIYAEFILCKKFLNYLDGLADVSSYKKRIVQLNNSDALKKIIEKKSELAKEELKRQEAYRNNFVLKDLQWWENEIRNLNNTEKNKGDEENFLMSKRLLGYLGLLAYMQSSVSLQSTEHSGLEWAEKFLKIYQMADPENSEHQYLFAELYARKKENTKALFYLKNAIKLGFNDIARIKADSSFWALKNNPEYKQLIEK